MAKAKIKGLDEAIEEIEKNYKSVIKKAAEEAIEKAKDDLYATAVSCLVQYYEDYNPNSYDRTYSLIDSFVPYVAPIQEGADWLVCSAGVEFDATKLANTYYGSETYSPADADWILANFLSGIHPRTDGSTEPGGGNYEYQKKYGSFVPSEEMQRYVDRYAYIFDHNLKFAINKHIYKLMRK